ncbi:hypothetical protein KY285_027849 [Solanum tuberosum]|nr:hypothetical protein KY285_027849 [Solanum tuberosum]
MPRRVGNFQGLSGRYLFTRLLGLFKNIKKFLNNLGQAEKEFQVEVEVIGHVRHKNFVSLLGYCIEGMHRGSVVRIDHTGRDHVDYGRPAQERQSVSLNHVHEMLSSNVFEIQLRKSSSSSSNTTTTTLSILSYMEKQHTPQNATDRTLKR